MTANVMLEDCVHRSIVSVYIRRRRNDMFSAG